MARIIHPKKKEGYFLNALINPNTGQICGIGQTEEMREAMMVILFKKGKGDFYPCIINSKDYPNLFHRTDSPLQDVQPSPYI